MVDIQTVSIAIASASVFAGVIYYSLQIRHQNIQIQQQNRIRETDLVMRLYSTLSSKEFEEAWYKVYNLEFRDPADYLKKYGSLSGETPTNIALSIVFNFFEGVAILLHKKLTDIDLVYDLFGTRIIATWDKFAQISEEVKEQIEKELPIAKRSFLWIGYLYNEMKEYQQQKGVQRAQCPLHLDARATSHSAP